MRKASILFFTCFVAGVLLPASAALGQVRLIVDTDHTTDVDDVGALGLLHGLADTGEVEIMGIIGGGARC